ncbi:hypothetical protein WDZ92_32955 [Nostoc sp. NIES-2111]
MTSVPWRLAIQIAPGAFAYLGEAQAENFEDACRILASTRPDFLITFTDGKAYMEGRELMALTDAVDGRFDLIAHKH